MNDDKKTSNAVDILHRRYYANPKRLKRLELERTAYTRKTHEPECANRSSVEKNIEFCICKELE